MKVNSHETNAEMLGHLLPLMKLLPDRHLSPYGGAKWGLTRVWQFTSEQGRDMKLDQ